MTFHPLPAHFFSQLTTGQTKIVEEIWEYFCTVSSAYLVLRVKPHPLKIVLQTSLAPQCCRPAIVTTAHQYKRVAAAPCRTIFFFLIDDHRVSNIFGSGGQLGEDDSLLLASTSRSFTTGLQNIATINHQSQRYLLLDKRKTRVNTKEQVSFFHPFIFDQGKHSR